MLGCYFSAKNEGDFLRFALENEKEKGNGKLFGLFGNNDDKQDEPSEKINPNEIEGNLFVQKAEEKEKRIEELEREMEAPNFWDDAEIANQKMKNLKNLKDTVELYSSLATQYEDIETLIEMGYEEEDEAMVAEVRDELDSFISTLDDLRISTLLNGEFDKNNAILKLNAGAGGTESCDWAQMLYRMYTRWAEKKGFTVEVLDFLDGDEAGIKCHAARGSCHHALRTPFSASRSQYR